MGDGDWVGPDDGAVGDVRAESDGVNCDGLLVGDPAVVELADVILSYIISSLIVTEASSSPLLPIANG